MAPRKKGLGRGLSALMNDSGLSDTEKDVSVETKSTQPLGQTGEEAKLIDQLIDTKADVKAEAPSTPDEKPRVAYVSIDRLKRNYDQPRRMFDQNALDDLIASIQQKGVLQPILVRPLSEAHNADYQVVAGERRWRAAIKAGLTSIPIIIRDLSDRDVLEIGIVENVQRADLNPLEEALAYEKLIHEFGRTQAEIATTIGKSRVHVANTVRLTGLTPRARDLLMQGQITAGHARAILSAKDADALAEAIVEHSWTVRDAESWVKQERNGKAPSSKPRQEKPADIKALEQRIQDTIGYGADIRHGSRGGEIRFKYKDLDHMEALLSRLGLMSS